MIARAAVAKREEGIRDFLRACFGRVAPDDYIEVRYSHSVEFGNGIRSEFFAPARGEGRALTEFLVDQTLAVPHHLHFTPHPRTARDRAAPLAETGRLFWADLDGVPDEHVSETTAKLLRWGASRIYRSGAGIHAYWTARDPVSLSTLSFLFRAAPHVLGGDPAMSPSHLLRVPCSANCKRIPVFWTRPLSVRPVLVDLEALAAHWKRLVPAEKLKDAAPHEPAPVADALDQRDGAAARAALLQHCALAQKAVRRPEELGHREWVALAVLYRQTGLPLRDFLDVSALDPCRYDEKRAIGLWQWTERVPSMGCGDVRCRACGDCRGVGYRAKMTREAVRNKTKETSLDGK